MVDVLWLRPPTAGGGRVAEGLHLYYDPAGAIGQGADFESFAPLAGLVGKEGVDVGAEVGLEVVFRLDFETLAYFKLVQGARFLEPVVTKTGRANPTAIFAAEARSFARGTRSSGSIMPGRENRKN